jgi:hypothetical protein
VFLLLVSGLVVAQEADVDVPVRARAEISVEEMRTQAAKYEQGMNEILRRMVQLQEVARKEKDVIKLNCVNDKLAPKTNLEEAIARNDEESRYHEFGRITIAQQQAGILGGDAENCVGEDLTFLGPTQVTVDEPALPDEPVAGPEFPVVEPLPIASPQA